VLVVLSFECAAGNDAIYDATKLLATQSPQAWEVGTIICGNPMRQVTLNGESSIGGAMKPRSALADSQSS